MCPTLAALLVFLIETFDSKDCCAQRSNESEELLGGVKQRRLEDGQNGVHSRADGVTVTQCAERRPPKAEVLGLKGILQRVDPATQITLATVV